MLIGGLQSVKNIKNASILKLGLIFIIISYVAGALYSMSLVLKEPVFFKHYYESHIHSRSVKSIHLITNSNDDRQIVQIEFPQLPEDFAYVSLRNVWNNDNGYDRINEFAHYDYKILYFEFINVDEDLSGGEEESIVLDKAEIRYMNGDVQYVDIGKIVLHKNFKLNEFFYDSSSSSSSNFSSKLYTKVLKDININNIESSFDDELEGFLEMTVNNLKQQDIQYPMSFNSGEYINFNSNYIYDDLNDMRRYNVYDVIKIISITDSEGNKGNELLHNLDYEPMGIISSEKEIIDYLRYRGVK